MISLNTLVSCDPQVSSKWVRYQVMKARISRYFKTDANLRHVEHYAKHCSIGDWFVLYQMSRNMNTRYLRTKLLNLRLRELISCPVLLPRLSAMKAPWLVSGRTRNWK